jgi:hypothetical protein
VRAGLVGVRAGPGREQEEHHQSTSRGAAGGAPNYPSRPHPPLPDRYEYRPTQKGLDLFPVIFPVIVALMAWGDRDVMGGRPPLVFRHRGCGGGVTDRRVCARCGQEVTPREVEPRPGPGALEANRAGRIPMGAS